MADSQIPLTSQLVRQGNADFPLASTNDLHGTTHIYADEVLFNAAVINSPSLFEVGQLVVIQSPLATYQIVNLSPLTIVGFSDMPFGLAPAGYVLLIGVDGAPAWMRMQSSDVLATLANSAGPTMSNRPTNGLLQLGQSFAPAFTFTLSRLPVGAYRNGVLVPAISRVRDLVSLTDTAIVATNGVTPAATTDTILNLVRTWHFLVQDALRNPVLDVDSLTTTRGVLAYMGLVSNTATFVPAATLFADDFEAYATDADLPQGSWTTSGNTGTGQQRIKTTFTIASPSSATGTFVPFAGTKQLFLGNLSGTSLLAVNGRRKAIVAVDLTTVQPVVQISFRKRQLGNDAINFAGFDLDVTHSGGTTQLIHEETNHTTGWVLKTADLTPYIGQIVTLTFSVYDDNSASDPVAILLDDVLVEAGANVVPPPPGPGDITEAYIEAISNSGIVARPLFPGFSTPAGGPGFTISQTTARVIVAYPTDTANLPPPVKVRFVNMVKDLPLTLLVGSIPVTNAFGVTKNYDVFLSDQIGSTGSGVGLSLISFSPYGTYVAEVLADSPFVYWRYDEDAPAYTALALDTSGNNRPATVTGSSVGPSTSVIADVGNGALTSFLSPNTFSILRDITGLGLDPPVAAGQGFTVEWWSKAAFGPEVGKRYTVLGVESAVPATGQFYIYHTGVGFGISASQLRAGWVSGTSDLITVVAGGVLSNSSRHYVVVFAFDNIKFYLNGALIQTQVVAAPAGAAYTRFGAPNQVGTDEWLTSHVLDEVALYAAELSPARILAHYQAGIT